MRSVPDKVRFFVGGLLLMPLLAGCNNPQTPGFNGKINDANAIAVAATGYFAVARMIPFSNLGDRAVTGVDVSPQAAAFDLADFAKVQIEALAALSGQYPSSALTGVMTTMAYACNTGSGSIAWDDKDGDGKFSTGDTFVFTFNDCAVRDIIGTLVYSNQMTMTQFMLTGDPVNDPSQGWQMSALLTLSDLSVNDGATTRVYSGAYDFSSKSPDGARESIAISGQSVTGTANNGSDVLKDFVVTDDIDRAAFTYTNLVVNATLDSAKYGVLTLKTVAAFSGTTPFDPAKGTMLITAEDKSSVKMSVDNAQSITLQIDANGDGVIDTTQTTDWSVLHQS